MVRSGGKGREKQAREPERTNPCGTDLSEFFSKLRHLSVRHRRDSDNPKNTSHPSTRFTDHSEVQEGRTTTRLVEGRARRNLRKLTSARERVVATSTVSRFTPTTFALSRGMELEPPTTTTMPDSNHGLPLRFSTLSVPDPGGRSGSDVLVDTVASSMLDLATLGPLRRVINASRRPKGHAAKGKAKLLIDQVEGIVNQVSSPTF